MKFVAILLGTAGVGIMKLLDAPLELIISITGLGISISAVRDISNARNSNDPTKIAIAIKTLYKWAWVTGLLGMVVTISLAPMLSRWAFGNDDYAWAFVWLSIILLLQSLRKGQTAMLQGMRKLKHMAKASVIGSALGLFTSIPLYYYYGIEGIVPAMILTALTGLFLSWYFSRKIKTEPVKQTYKETYTAGLGMAKLGIYITLSGFLASASTYILNIYISKWGGLEQVGLYNAGWGLIAQYTGMIFTAMATDYYPRLSAIHDDIEKVKNLVKQQAKTALFIMTPILVLAIVAMSQLIRLLYSPEFIPAVFFANLIILGIPLKAVSWSMGYIYLAKGNGRLFITLEFIMGMVLLPLNLSGYYLFELNGLGISYSITWLLAFAINYSVLKYKYYFSFPNTFWGVFLFIYLFTIAAFGTSLFQDNVLRYISGITVFSASMVYSIYQLNKVMDLKSVVIGIVNRIRSKKN